MQKDELTDRCRLLGSYLISLNELSRAHSGKRVKAITRFLESPYELSRKGWRQYIKDTKGFVSESERRLVCDFLYFCGIRTGQVRKEKAKLVKKLDVVSENNKKAIASFIGWVDAQREYSQSSIRMKSDNMKKYFRYFTEFNNDNCRSFIKTMESEGMSPKTLNIYMLTLKQYGEFVKRPVKLKKISIQQSFSVENVPTEKEYSKFIRWLYDNRQWQTYWMVKILGMTGVRLSELIQIRWVDILNGEYYPRCKGKKHRMVFFPKSLIQELNEWLKDNPVNKENLVIFSKRNDAPLSYRGISQKIHNAALKAGFPKEKAHCHAFRHFFAKQYLAKTKDVIQLAELLGHESVDTTRLYLQKSKEEQRREINRNINW